MQITWIAIRNYKSLKDVSLSLKPLSLVVGANASGKSNLADCIDFISEIYRHGLEIAVSRKGGYENIAFRRTRRSKQPIAIDLSIELSTDEAPPWYSRRREKSPLRIKVDHSFSFVARGYSIRASFQIVQETVTVSIMRENVWLEVLEIVRDENNAVKPRSKFLSASRRTRSSEQNELVRDILGLPNWSTFKQFLDHASLTSTDLLIGFLSRFGIGGLYIFRQAVEGIRVFQISPTKSREFGVPTPRPELSRSGANLPAVVDMMKKDHSTQWESVMQTMRSILPDLNSIDVDYTSSRTLGLFFREKGLGRPWSVDEVSDGTIQTLGLLVTIFDPALNALVIEEPENSVHPWIVRHILDACRQASQSKQIIITTHSPIVINSISPEDILVIWRANGETRIKELTKLDQGFISLWQQGDIPTFEYLDSGALSYAIPPAPSTRVEEE